MAKVWCTENVPTLAQDGTNATVWRLIVSIVAYQHDASQLLVREPVPDNSFEVATCNEMKSFLMATCGETFKPCLLPLTGLQCWKFLSIAVKPSSASTITLGSSLTPETPRGTGDLPVTSPVPPLFTANPVAIPSSIHGILMPEGYPIRYKTIPVQPAPLLAVVEDEKERDNLRKCYTAPPRLLLLENEQPQPLVPISKFVPNANRRKAVVIGINYAGGNSLGGCVRDAIFMTYLLLTRYDFKPTDIRLMVDEQVHGLGGVKTGKPTRENILEAITWLMGDAVPGDSLFFSFSGHGTQFPDDSGDEISGWDQAICALGDESILDDELYDVLVRRVPKGARLTAFVDACHSGTVLDLPYMYDLSTGIRHDARVADVEQDSSSDKKEDKEEEGPVGKRERFRNSLSKLKERLRSKKKSKENDTCTNGSNSGSDCFYSETEEETTARTLASREYVPLPDSKGGQVVLVSGCHNKEYSFESEKSGETTGLTTFSFIEVLERGLLPDSQQYTFAKLLKEMHAKVTSWSTDQTPQFSSSHPFNLNSPFIL